MKPTDDTIALTAFLLGREWLSADEICEGLAQLGFRRPTIQGLVSRLTAMCKESAPRFERRRVLGFSEYRVSSWAATGLGNQWKGFDGLQVGHGRPVPQPEGLRSEGGQG